MAERPFSVGFCGVSWGDEGKGKMADQQVKEFEDLGKKVFVYRDNGGSNAGHTIELDDGRRPATHLLPSGIFYKNATVILGKGMVIHPNDLMSEIGEMADIAGEKGIADIMVDQKAILNLDTHRALESMQRQWFSGGKGSTGRGIAQSYNDFLAQCPLLVEDLISFDERKIGEHYDYYEAWVKGLGGDLKDLPIFRYKSLEPTLVGSKDEFVRNLEKQAESMSPFIYDVNPFLRVAWSDHKNAFVFEKAQAIGLDPRFGVYPDVTASDTTFGGILYSTEGEVDPYDIELRYGVFKATYGSSVGSRILPTMMERPEHKKMTMEELSTILTPQELEDVKFARRIRGDYKEVGASTGRLRDMLFTDLVPAKYFLKKGIVNRIILTHMDAVYPGVPVKLSVGYTKNGEESGYRPYQDHMLMVRPRYIEMPTWSQEEIQKARTPDEIPEKAKDFIKKVEDETEFPVGMITTGPKRDQFIRLQ